MGRGELFRRKLFLKAWILLCMLLNAVTPQAAEDGLSQCQIESIIKEITSPDPEYQMHVAALRNQLRSLLGRRLPEDNFLDSDNDSLDTDKRSIGSLARSGMLNNGKRFIGSLARTDSLRSQFDAIKRSIATLAKNGQLPSREPDYSDSTQQWGEKRNLGSLAKSGNLAGKRNIGSLARDFQLPSASAGKRNLASLAREGLVPYANYKRNMASLARMGVLPAYKRDLGSDYWSDGWDSSEISKRNLGALKSSPVHGSRQKRDVVDDYEIADPVLQNSAPVDYDEVRNAINHIYNSYYGNTNNEEKRFLGSVARSGWYQYRPASLEKRNLQSLARNGMLRHDLSRYVSSLNGRDLYRQQEQKRHIGSVARSGWLPAFRPIRSGRFSRSGRARTDFTSHKSDFDNPSWAIVDDATLDPEYSPTLLHGAHLAYNLAGALHHDSQHYIGEVYDVPNPIINPFDPNNSYYASYNYLPDGQVQHLQGAMQHEHELEYEIPDSDNNSIEYDVYNNVNNNIPNDANSADNDHLYELNLNANYLY